MIVSRFFDEKVWFQVFALLPCISVREYVLCVLYCNGFLEYFSLEHVRLVYVMF